MKQITTDWNFMSVILQLNLIATTSIFIFGINDKAK